MKRFAMLLILAASALGGLAGCDPSANTPLPDPTVDGVSGRKPRAVDESIMQDQKKLYEDRKAEMDRTFAASVTPATVPASAPISVEAPTTTPAPTTAPADVAPPTADATAPAVAPPADAPK